MISKEEIAEIVISQVEELNETFPEDQQIRVEESTVLFGVGSSIDSLSLVSVIVDLEMLFSEKFEMEFSLTDDRAMTRSISPFDTVMSLTDYSFELIGEKI